jgi:TolB-like protein/Flp pilus assembly protein TadD
MDFVNELKRRNVFRVGMAYVLAAWLLIQIAEALFPAFNVPDSILRGMVFVLLLGFPVALLVSWIYDITPEGIKRDSETVPSDSISRQPRRKLDFTIIGLLAVAVVYFAIDKFVLQTPEEDPVAEQAIPPQRVAEERPSLAVLPFQNRSTLEEDAYFVDGIHDDILTQLAKIGGLTVIARTSVEQFRDTRMPVRQIAEQLGVTTILEGGVQRAGDRVRINIQLIDATNEAHLWAETYDKQLTAVNIFAIQTEVAVAVANAMKTTLTPEQAVRVSTIPTQNLEAWEVYQLGRFRLGQSTADDNTLAQELFSRAIKLDPGFALAYVGLARASISQQYSTDVSREAALDRATEATTKALSLDPDLPEGVAMFAALLVERHEYEQAEPQFIRALELNPNSAAALQGYAQLLPFLGRNNEAIAPGERLVQLDPLDVGNHQSLGIALFSVGRFNDALARFSRAVEIDESHFFSYHELGHILAALGRYDLAVPYYETALDLGKDYWMNWMFLGSAYLALGDDAEAERLVSEALLASGRNQIAPFYYAAALRLYQGDEEGSVALLEEAQALDLLRPGPSTMLADHDLRVGNVRKARERLGQLMPELLIDDPVLADVDCSCTSIPLATVLQRNGEFERAERLLHLSEVWNSKLPRLGPFGYGTTDVEMHALRGDTAKALTALREAEKAGWRDSFWRYQRDLNPALDSIRNEAKFKAVFDDIEHDMDRQRATLAERTEDSKLDLDSWQLAVQEARISEQ